jgi:hypothetical protein
MSAEDKVGNVGTWTRGQVAVNYDTTFAVTSGNDNVAPVVTDFQFWPASVDTDLAQKVITVRINVTEWQYGSGFQSADMQFKHALTANYMTVSIQYWGLTWTDPTNANHKSYERNWVVPQYTRTGDWTLYGGLVMDYAQNNNTVGNTPVVVPSADDPFPNNAASSLTTPTAAAALVLATIVAFATAF